VHLYVAMDTAQILRFAATHLLWCLLVALTLSPDLFICAKQLLIDANGARRLS
jgi:hypothetical protein